MSNIINESYKEKYNLTTYTYVTIAEKWDRRCWIMVTDYGRHFLAKLCSDELNESKYISCGSIIYDVTNILDFTLYLKGVLK
jgi:hypothetical protein